MAKPFSIQSPENIAKEYGGNKQKIAQAMQMGIVDATAGVLAGMFIDRMRSGQMEEQAQKPTVAQQVMSGAMMPGAGAMGNKMQEMAAPGAPPIKPMVPPTAGGMGAGMQAQASMGPGGNPVGMAEGGSTYAAPYTQGGGLSDLPVPDGLFDEPSNGGYAGGGIVAFAGAGSVDMADLYDDVEQAESGGRQGAVSPKGAFGVMQLMPGTSRDPGYGVTPMRDNSEAENRRVGREYLDAMHRKYGDRATALMAYNWGPGNVDKWIAAGRPADAVPTETRNYLSKVMGGAPAPATGGLGANVGAPPMQTLAGAMPGIEKEARSWWEANVPEPKNEGIGALMAEARRIASPEEQKKRRDEDKWMTLAEIGFNMASTTSPYLLQAVGAAAAAALPGARAAKKEREADKRQAMRDLAEYEGITYKQAVDKANGIRTIMKDRADATDKDIIRAQDVWKTRFTQGEETNRQRIAAEATVTAAGLREGVGGSGPKPMTNSQSIEMLSQFKTRVNDGLKAMRAAESSKDYARFERAAAQYRDALVGYNRVSGQLGVPGMQGVLMTEFPDMNVEFKRRRASATATSGGSQVNAGNPPAGVTQGEWNAMTPQERALFR